MKQPSIKAASDKDAEANTGLLASTSKVRRNFATKQVLTLIAIVVLTLSAVFGIAVLASVCERSWHEDKTSLHLDVTEQSGSGHHELEAREAACDCEDDEMFIAHESPVTLVSNDAVPVPSVNISATPSSDYEVRIPISTQTELSTLYSVSKVVKLTTLISTSTEEYFMTLSETECTPSVITETQTALVTVTVVPLSSSEGYATITGFPSTVTDHWTSTSYTGLPDVTISGNPSTLTDIQTEVSYTSGLPDVTVSGKPSTVTDLQTSISISSDAVVTVSGTPSTVTDIAVSYSLTSSKVVVTISDLWGTQTGMSTVTTVDTTTKTTATTISTDVATYYPVPTSSTILYTSDAKGEGFTRTRISATVIVDPPYPTNGTATVHPSGTVTAMPIPTTPIIVSGAAKLGGSMIAIAGLMFLL